MADGEWRFAYEGTLSGIGVGGGVITVARSDGIYRAVVDIRTHGIADMLFPLTMQAIAEGQAPPGAALASYRSGSRYRGKDTTILLQWAAGRTIETRSVQPPVDAGDRKFVPPELTRGTVDPIAAGFLAGEAIARGAGCAQRIPVFDGRRRYDVVLSPDPIEAVASIPVSADAVRCRFTQERIAGFGKKQPVELDEEEPTRVWLAAPSPGAPVVPVRIESKTSLGTFLIRLVERPAG